MIDIEIVYNTQGLPFLFVEKEENKGWQDLERFTLMEDLLTSPEGAYVTFCKNADNEGTYVKLYDVFIEGEEDRVDVYFFADRE